MLRVLENMDFFRASIITLIVLCCQRIFQAMNPSSTTIGKQMSYTIRMRIIIHVTIMEQVEESRDTTDLVTFPRGSYGARGVVLLGEDRKENTEMGLVVMETDLERLHLP